MTQPEIERIAAGLSEEKAHNGFLKNFAIIWALFAMIYITGWLCFCFASLEWFNPLDTRIGRYIAAWLTVLSAIFGAIATGGEKSDRQHLKDQADD